MSKSHQCCKAKMNSSLDGLLKWKDDSYENAIWSPFFHLSFLSLSIYSFLIISFYKDEGGCTFRESS